MQHRPRRTRRQWQDLLTRQQQSDMNVTEFCRQESVGLSSFYLWRTRLGFGSPAKPSRSEASPFVALGQLDYADRQLNSIEASAGWELELNLGRGLTLKLRQR